MEGLLSTGPTPSSLLTVLYPLIIFFPHPSPIQVTDAANLLPSSPRPRAGGMHGGAEGQGGQGRIVGAGWDNEGTLIVTGYGMLQQVLLSKTDQKWHTYCPSYIYLINRSFHV